MKVHRAMHGGHSAVRASSSIAVLKFCPGLEECRIALFIAFLKLLEFFKALHLVAGSFLGSASGPEAGFGLLNEPSGLPENSAEIPLQGRYTFGCLKPVGDTHNGRCQRLEVRADSA